MKQAKPPESRPDEASAAQPMPRTLVQEIAGRAREYMQAMGQWTRLSGGASHSELEASASRTVALRDGLTHLHVVQALDAQTALLDAVDAQLRQAPELRDYQDPEARAAAAVSGLTAAATGRARLVGDLQLWQQRAAAEGNLAAAAAYEQAVRLVLGQDPARALH